MYLNYRLIDNVKREEAVESYHDSIEELLHDEAIVKRKHVEQEEKEAQRIIHRVSVHLMMYQKFRSFYRHSKFS